MNASSYYRLKEPGIHMENCWIDKEHSHTHQFSALNNYCHRGSLSKICLNISSYIIQDNKDVQMLTLVIFLQFLEYLLKLEYPINDIYLSLNEISSRIVDSNSKQFHSVIFYDLRRNVYSVLPR